MTAYTTANPPLTGTRVGVYVGGVLCEAIVEPCAIAGLVAVQYRKPDKTWAQSQRMTIHPERLRVPPAGRLPHAEMTADQQALVRHMADLLRPARERAARQARLVE